MGRWLCVRLGAVLSGFPSNFLNEGEGKTAFPRWPNGKGHVQVDIERYVRKVGGKQDSFDWGSQQAPRVGVKGHFLRGKSLEKAFDVRGLVEIGGQLDKFGR